MKSDRAQLDSTAQDRVVAIVRAYPIQYLTNKRLTKALLPKIDSDDVVQEIMLSLFRSVAPEKVFRLHDAGELRPWLTTMIRNRVNGVLRELATRKRCNGHRTYNQADQDQSGSFILLKGVVDEGRSPSSVEAAVEAKDAMLAVLVNLPPMYKRALSLCYLEGYSAPDVARIMGHPLGVVRGLLHRGRRMLRARMGPADQWFSKAESEDRLWQLLGHDDEPEAV